MKKLNLLCIDIEGGHGGSSRSLYYALQNINSNDLNIEVICRLDSWIQNAYKNKNIKCTIERSIPRYTVLQKINRNIIQIIIFFICTWPKSYFFRKKLQKKIKKFDIIHLNHISLFFIAKWIKKHNPNIKITMHIRTLPYKNIFSRLQAKIAIKYCDKFIFITENELMHMKELANKEIINGEIIYNPIIFPTESLENYYKIPQDKRLKINVLSHFSYMRGIDRIVNIMENIPNKYKKDILFIVAGDMKIKEKLPKSIDKNLRLAKSLKDYIKEKQLDQYFIFLGRIDFPEKLLPHIDLLIKPTRENNPWGRDILEAMSHKKPVVSVGKYNRFVETNVTGLLQKEFNSKLVADWLSSFVADKKMLYKFGENAKSRINKFCEVDKVSRQIKAFWINL